MIRNLKALGLTLIAVFALGAVATSAASALEFTAEAYPATLTGEPESGTKEEFVTTFGGFSCKTIKYHGTIVAATTTFGVTATYGGATDDCTFNLFPTIVDTNGCSYLFHSVAGSPNITTDIVCPVGKEITQTVNQNTAGTLTEKCTIHIPPQAGINGFTYTSTGAGTTREITVDIGSNNIKYTQTAGTGFGVCKGGSASNGTLLAKWLFTGENVPPASGHVGIFFS